MRMDGEVRTHGGELRSHMDNHDCRHHQCEYVHEVGGSLKDDGICQLDAACITIGLDSGPAGDGGHWAKLRAERLGALLAFRREISEAHTGLPGLTWTMDNRKAVCRAKGILFLSLF